MNGANLVVMRRLASAIQAAPFKMLLYKGPLLQQIAYGNLFARPSSDIDVLVAPADYDKAAGLLQDLGFKLNPMTDTIWWRRFLAEQQFREGPDGLAIDLHHRVQQPGCPLPRKPGRFLAEAAVYEVAGQGMSSFSLRHTILVAAISLVKALHHREPAGRYVSDVEALTSNLTDQQVSDLWQEARLQGLAHTLELAMRSVSAVFGRPEATRAVLPEISDTDLRQMLIDPDKVDTWVRRRRLLQSLCDRPIDIVPCWMLMAAGEAAR
ncbi:hypothetical protein LTR94_025722, partial [Friedmanniomyces endolithicus]